MKNKYDFYCDQVLSGKTPVHVVFESSNVIAFHHTKPMYSTHIVITSKKHILDLIDSSEMDLIILNEITKVARDLAKNLDKNMGIRLFTNMGKFQDTPHIHYHLVVGEKLSPL